MSSSHVPLMLSRQVLTSRDFIGKFCIVFVPYPPSPETPSPRARFRSRSHSAAFIFYEHDARGATSTLAGARPAVPAGH